MLMKVSPWIYTKTYFVNNTSISFIKNIKTGIFYIIKGTMSDLWFNIVSFQDYKKINKYAENKNIKEKEKFFFFLKQNNIIQTKTEFPKPDDEFSVFSMGKGDKNIDYVETKRKRLAVENNFLDVLYLELNYKCNLHCRHCCNPKDTDGYEITFEQAKKIIDEACESGVDSVCLTGGECTINRDFLKTAKYVRSKYLALYFLTNGQKLYDDKRFFNEVVNIWPSTIKISLYSMNPDVHDNITGVKGSHKKTLQVIKRLKEKGITVVISCTLISANAEDYKAVENFAKSMNLSCITDHKFINNPKNKNSECRCSFDVMKKVYSDDFVDYDIRHKSHKDKRLVCVAGTERLSIAPNLDIRPCLYVNYIFGNYNSVSLKEVRDTIVPKFKKIFIRENLKECFKHDYCEACTLCPLYASLNRGFMKKDKTLCMDAKAYYKAYLQSKREINVC